MEVKMFFRAVLDSGIVRAWTGKGDFDIDEPFAPDGTAPGETGVTYTEGIRYLGTDDNSVRFGMSGEGLRNVPVVGYVVDVFSAGFLDDGTWKLLPFVRRGLLDNPMVEAGVYTVSIVPRVYPAPGSMWSHEEHERETKTDTRDGDTFFSQMRALSKGINGIHFPGVPTFREERDYDNRFVQQPASRPGKAGSSGSGLTGTPVRGEPGVALVGAASVRLPSARSRLRRGF